jgi:shikimate kinase
LRRAGRVVYLRAAPEVLAARAAADPAVAARPLLVGASPAEEARVLFAERDPLYRAFAEEIVDAEGPLERTVAALVAIASRDEN